MKKIVLLLILMGLFIVSGCDNKKEEEKENTIKITDFEGIYKKDKYEMYIVSTDEKTLKYYVIDELKNKNFGTLTYKDGVASNDDTDEVVTVRLDEKNIKLELKNITNYPSGKYERTGDYSVEEFYKAGYGKEEFFDSKFNGKYINEDKELFVYQPDKNTISFTAKFPEEEIGCEAELDEDNEAICTIIDSKYILTLNDNELLFKAKFKDKSKNYKITFTKEKTLTKQMIINIFDSYGLIDN